MLEQIVTDSVKVAAWIIAAVIAATVFFAPWIYHIVWCIEKAEQSGSAIALLIVGVVFPPLGWVHGICLTFGATWI